MNRSFWQRPDPRPYYFTMPNEIFRQEISACEFAILAYLFFRRARMLDPPNLMTVCKNLCVSRNTLKKYVRRLQDRDWIVAQHRRFSFPLVLSMRDTIHLTSTLKPRDGRFFPLPKNIFGFGLSVGELAVYGYLLYREDRKTFECWPSYRTIGAALRISKNTVRKYVHRLEDKGYIVTEPTSVTRKDGTKWNGNLKFHIRPIREIVEQRNAEERERAELERRLYQARKLAAQTPGFTVEPRIPEGRP
ncbi:MAG: helix-turn-helix domain-containing protein [Acidaminococcaceae bacterium]|nr:helix-turn-helix domain-containing protein [Acidaminococcaceae bacterium]